MRIRRSIRGLMFGLLVLLGAPIVYYFLILDWQGRPFCHKQIMVGLLTFVNEKRTKDFPNVEGSSWKSILAFEQEMAGTNWARHYRYVPGLRQDDPRELVLLYLDQPTRWVWHGSPRTIFQEKAWIIVKVDFSGRGECSDRVSTEEFTRRLQGTLDFIRTNDRPNWRAIVAEHEDFLKGVPR